MTEREAIEAINKEYESFLPLSTSHDFDTAMAVSIKALEELALYKEGKLCLVPADIYEKQCKELDELKEKQTAKKPVPRLVLGELFSYCPVCEMVLNHGQSHCDRCGQKIDWEEG